MCPLRATAEPSAVLVRMTIAMLLQLSRAAFKIQHILCIAQNKPYAINYGTQFFHIQNGTGLALLWSFFASLAPLTSLLT